jgi:hypothetical protein
LADANAEYRPYTRALQGAFATIVTLSVSYLVISIGVAIFQRHDVLPRGAPIADRPSQTELLSCQDDVERLFGALNDQVFGLQALHGREEIDLAQRWEGWRTEWLRRWRQVGVRCRFGALRDRGLGPGYDHLAYLHEELETIEQQYGALLERFMRNEAPNVGELRRKIGETRKLLEAGGAARAAPNPSSTP